MNLKFETKSVNVVTDHDFDEFVNSIYGDGYELVPNQEMNNDSHLMITVPSVYPDFDWRKRQKAQVRSGDYPDYCAWIILECLHEDGHIPEGTYLIVCNR